MIEVKLYNHDPTRIMEIVRELRTSGLVQGKDFDFAYHKATYAETGWDRLDDAHTVFMFHTEKYATLFAIKYST
jgi:hypothetical protein